MSKKERVGALFLTVIGVLLIAVKFYLIYIDGTVKVPRVGGVYNEAIVGDVKYIDPIMAQTDAEKSISRLIFPGLVKIDSSGTPTPDLAEKWDISTDGKVYTFYLRQGLVFSDNSPLTSADVNFTVDSIKNQPKSPLSLSWSGVTATVIDERTISFSLPNEYGPFIYNCNFGIIPSHLSSGDFAKSLVGAGMYNFSKFVEKESKVSEVSLTRNSNYFAVKPYLLEINFKIFGDKTSALKEYESNKKITAIFGNSQSSIGTKFDYLSTRRLGLVLNMRKDALKDIEVRNKILNGGKFETTTALSLVTLDAPAQKEKAEEIKKTFLDQNVELTISYLGPLKYQDALAAKNYDLLLYGFDLGYDRDPYPYWHSSQLAANNFAGWSDKGTDILIEDARMLTDYSKRNAKYNEFFTNIDKQHLVKFYDPISYQFMTKNFLHGVSKIENSQVTSRFDNIGNWYLFEKRVQRSSK